MYLNLGNRYHSPLSRKSLLFSQINKKYPTPESVGYFLFCFILPKPGKLAFGIIPIPLLNFIFCLRKRDTSIEIFDYLFISNRRKPDRITSISERKKLLYFRHQSSIKHLIDSPIDSLVKNFSISIIGSKK